MTNEEAKAYAELAVQSIKNDNDENTIAYEFYAYVIKALSEPTIPLSVIEKITETMEVEYASADELADWFSDGDKTEASFYRGKASGIVWVKDIIDEAVREVSK